MKKTVCIIGAGVAGLTSIKHCLEEGFEAICYEKDTDIGGLWNYHEHAHDGDPSIYNSCHTNSSKELTCFSDFPIPKDFPNFMGHKHFKTYLDMYADNFLLKQCIYFKHRVEKVERFGANRRWKVLVKDIVYISTRTGRYIRPRTAEYGVPFDHFVVTRFNQCIPKSLMPAIQYHKLNYRFKHTNYGLAPNCKFDESAQTISDELPNRIICGTISMKTKIRKISEKDVTFDDGSKIESIDVIILATGYKFNFPFLDNSIIQINDQFPYLYKFVFPVQLDTLAVIGLVRPFGGLPPIIEMQARWACAVFADKCSLPFPNERRRSVEEWGKHLKQSYGEYAYSTPRFRVYIIQYVDDLASMIGCKPNVRKYFFNDITFWYKIFFGPATPPQWRLSGPGKWPGARKAIEHLERNTYYPMQTRKSGCGERNGLYNAWIKLIVCLFSLFVAINVFLF